MLTICLAPGSSFRPRNQICARDNQANLANENTEKFKSLDEVINIQGSLSSLRLSGCGDGRW